MGTSGALTEGDIPTLTTAGKVSGDAINTGTIGGATVINTTGNITSTGTISGNTVTTNNLSSKQVHLFDSDSSNKVTLQSAPIVSTDFTLTLPDSAGTNGYMLTTDGSGVLAWSAPMTSINWASVTSKPTTLAGYGITDAVQAGTLGSAAALNTGTSANNVVKLDGSGRLPAVDGSQLTGLPSGSALSVTPVSTNITPNSSDNGKLFTLDGGASDIDVNLPSASGNPNLQFQFLRKGIKRVNLIPNGADTINGYAGKTLNSQYASVSIISDGSEWLILNAIGSIVNYSLEALGILDTSFNGSGKVVNNNIAGGNSYDYYKDVTLDGAGKILVVGASYNGTYDDIIVSRFNSDGTIDTSFGGGDGVFIFDSGNSDMARSITISPGGDIYIGGTTYDTIFSNTDFLIIKIFPDGSGLDGSFDGDGKLIFSSSLFGGLTSTWEYGGRIQFHNNKIVFAAHFEKDSSVEYNNLVVARFNTDGTLDTTFNTVGYATHGNAAGGHYESIEGLAVSATGEVYACGNAYNGSNNKMTIWKFTNSGTLDSSFNSTGFYVTSIANYSNCFGLAVTSGGNLYATGQSSNGSNDDITIWKFQSNGLLDSSFDGDGVFLFNGPSNQYDIGRDIAIDGSGNVLVCGSTNTPGTSDDMILLRLTPTGALDSSFGGGSGYVTHNSAAGGNSWDNSQALVISAEGVVVVGESQNSMGNSDAVIWRYQ